MKKILSITSLFIITLTISNVNGAAKGSWSEEYSKPYSNLVYGGQEGSDPSPTYVCRATFTQERSNTSFNNFYDEWTPYHATSLVPGKFVPHRKRCYIAFEKVEHGATEFEVLITNGRHPKKYKWIEGTGRIPENALQAGYTNRGAKLYLCRTRQVKVGKFFWKGRAELVGNIGKHWDRCFAPWNGSTRQFNEYEILVEK